MVETIDIVLFVLSFAIGFSPLVFDRIRNHRVRNKKYYRTHAYLFLACMFLAIGSFVRLCLLDSLPGGLNQDEASAGYDAFSIRNYGIDRNGRKFPVHLIAWGSGQNVAYSYLARPFLKLLGNTTIALRLPMAVMGCLSLYVLYFTLRTFMNDASSCFILIFLAINPWHIRKSRWALESNLFPELVLLSLLLLVLSIKKKNYFCFYFSAILLSFSAYSYGTSYFFLFFFVLGFLLYLLRKRIFPWYHSVLYLSLVAILCLPIRLFLYVNVFDKETIHLLWFDIPKLKASRFSSVTSLFSGNFLMNWKNNFGEGRKLLITQNDSLPWNSIPLYGTLYFLTLPFALIGLFHRTKKSLKDILLFGLRDKEKARDFYFYLLRLALFVSLLRMGILSNNINRINVIWPLLILLGAQGILDVLSCFKDKKPVKYTLSSLVTLYYLGSFVSFSLTYSLSYCKKNISPIFHESFREALLFSEKIKHETTYVSPKANYTLVLYYTKYKTKDYVDTVIRKNPGSAFENPYSFKGYVFSLPSTLEKGNTYIVYNDENPYSKEERKPYKITPFLYYSVIDTTEQIECVQ